MQVMYQDHYRRYTNASGVESCHLPDEIPKQVSFDQDYISFINKKGDLEYKNECFYGYTRTLFEQVAIVKVPSTFLSAAELAAGAESLLYDVVAALERVIERDWIPDRFHVVLHSSGFDSRLLSGLIRRIHRRRGDAWLGDVLFLCCTWKEIGSFKKIMRYEDWEPNQFWAYNDGVAPADYFATSFEFKTAWRHQNGIGWKPVNFFWTPIADLQELGVIPADENIDVWAALWANEIADSVKKGVAFYNERWRWWYYHVRAAQMVKGSHVFFPYTEKSVVRAIADLRDEDSKPNDIADKTWGRRLVTLLDPSLATFKNTGYTGRNEITSSLMRQACADYAGSWYGRHVEPGLEKRALSQNRYHHWWHSWSAASFVEHLRNIGVEVLL